MKKFILSVIVLTALVGVVQAAPFQTMGLLKTPDAYVIPHKAAQMVLAGYYRNVEKPTYMDQDKNGLNFYGMLGVGLFDRVQLDFFGGDYVYFFNAKVKLLEETAKWPQLAIGMDNILSPINKRRAQDYRPVWDPIAGEWVNPEGIDWADHPDKTDYEHYSGYAVASKQVVLGGIDWMFNLGMGMNRHTGQVPRSRWFSGFFSSIEVSPFDNFALQAEYDGKDFNAGVKYSYKNFGVRLGAAAVEDLAKRSEGLGYENNYRVALGISYLFDKFSEKGASTRPNLSLYATATDLEPHVVPGTHVPVAATDTGSGDVAIVTPGSQIPTPGIVTPGDEYKTLSPEAKDLLEELRLLRLERQKAQKALEDLRNWLQELKEENQ